MAPYGAIFFDPIRKHMRLRSSFIFSGYLWAAILIGFLYGFGLSGGFFIDDAPNLDPLLFPGIRASEFIFGGDAGPLGRPVALLTFWLQRGSYPESPEAFLLVNILIHVTNVLLVAWAVQRLQSLCPEILGSHSALPWATALIWGLMPVLASASLMVIQRMTTLSATFMLLGVHAYFWARAEAQSLRKLPWLLAVFGIAVCTLLATCSKENGALLPILLLVIHVTLLKNNEPKTVHYNHLQRLLMLVLVVPTLLVMVYVASRLPHISEDYWRRNFTVSERLASQVVILWEYLHAAFLPSWMQMSPFRDDYPARSFYDGAVQIALVAWLVVLAISFWCWKVNRPILAFALFWYISGHMLESSVFPLFLYFEHRNYIPLVGPVLAVVVWFLNFPISERVRQFLGCVYVVFLAVTLWQTTNTWGQRHLLAWAQFHSDSSRALQMMAGAYMQVGKVDYALRIYQDAIDRDVKRTSIALQGLRVSCYVDDGGVSARKWLGVARNSASIGEHSFLSINSLGEIIKLKIAKKCHDIEWEGLVGLLDALQANSLYSSKDDQSALYGLRAQVFINLGKINEAVNQLRHSLFIRGDADMLRLAYELIHKNGGLIDAEKFLQEVKLAPISGESLYMRRQWVDMISFLEAGY